MVARALVLLSDKDTDAPALTGCATVSKNDAWDHGAYDLGVRAAAGGALWVDRPYATGNPSVAWMRSKIQRVADAGGYCQVLNEPNLPIEGWRGGPSYYRYFYDQVKTDRTLYAPPSPGVAGWQDWVGKADRYAVHAYGTFSQMRSVVAWYLDTFDGDVYVTECNPGAGNTFDLNAWAENEFRPFLAWCNTEPRVKLVAYFAWRWDQSPKLPSSVDAKGTKVVDVLQEPLEDAPVDATVSMPTAVRLTQNHGGARAQTVGVFIHSTRGSAATPEAEYQATVSFFQSPAAQASAHLVVGPSEATRVVHDDDEAWHARYNNARWLGVEVVQAHATDRYADFQYRYAAEQCKLWAAKYGFPLRRSWDENVPGLIGHQDSQQGKADGKTDPGSLFDWARFLSLCTSPPVDTAKLEAELWGPLYNDWAKRAEGLGRGELGADIRSVVVADKHRLGLP